MSQSLAIAQSEVSEAPATPAERKISLLSSWDEKLMLGIPLLGIALCVGFRALGEGGISWNISDLTTLLIALILMDAVHVTFTYVLLFSVPELRKWGSSKEIRATRGWARGMSFWTRSAVLAAVLGGIIWVLKGSVDTKFLRGMGTIYLFLDLYAPTHHGMAQMRGISFCYNSKLRKEARLDKTEQALAARNEKWERRLFTGLLVSQIFYWIPGIFQLDQFHIPMIGLIKQAGGLLVPMTAFGLILNALWFPRQEKSNKALFLSRVLLYPLMMVTDVAALCLRATHGTEYLLIFRKMVRSSSLPAKKQRRVFWLTGAIVLAYGVIFSFAWPFVAYRFNQGGNADAVLAAAILVTFVTRFTHYYLDSVLFRMSDPTTRAAVSPLLMRDPGAAAAAPGDARDIGPAPEGRSSQTSIAS